MSISLVTSLELVSAGTTDWCGLRSFSEVKSSYARGLTILTGYFGFVS